MIACISPRGTARESPRMISCSAMETRKLLMANRFIFRRKKYTHFRPRCQRRNAWADYRYYNIGTLNAPLTLAPFLYVSADIFRVGHAARSSADDGSRAAARTRARLPINNPSFFYPNLVHDVWIPKTKQLRLARDRTDRPSSVICSRSSPAPAHSSKKFRKEEMARTNTSPCSAGVFAAPKKS